MTCTLCDFRPFFIISLASCSLTVAILELGYRSSDPHLSIYPAKVISGVMTCIGFLGAGALFREKHLVQGAGSAAAIWAAGALGIVCGMGFLWLAALLSGGIEIGRASCRERVVPAVEHAGGAVTLTKKNNKYTQRN